MPAVFSGTHTGQLHKGAVKSTLTFEAAVPGDLPYALTVRQQQILCQSNAVGVDQGSEIAAEKKKAKQA